MKCTTSKPVLCLSSHLFLLFIFSVGPTSSHNTRKKGKDPRVVNLRRSLFRKDAMNKKMKVEKDAVIDTASTANASAKRVVRECGEKVRASNDKVQAVRAETKSEIAEVRKEVKTQVSIARKASDVKV